MKKDEIILKAIKSADKEMKEFGKEHGFPVIFVLQLLENELGEIDGNKLKLTYFKKDQIQDAAKFASDNGGEFGIFDPTDKELAEPLKIQYNDIGIKTEIFVDHSFEEEFNIAAELAGFVRQSLNIAIKSSFQRIRTENEFTMLVNKFIKNRFPGSERFPRHDPVIKVSANATAESIEIRAIIMPDPTKKRTYRGHKFTIKTKYPSVQETMEKLNSIKKAKDWINFS